MARNGYAGSNLHGHLCKLTAGNTAGALQMRSGFSRPAETTLELYVPAYKLILVQVVAKLRLSYAQDDV